MTVEWTRRAARDLRRLSTITKGLILSKIDQYAEDPAALTNQVTTLTGSDYRRLRVGSYRVTFTVERGEATIMVIERVLHRREAYD